MRYLSAAQLEGPLPTLDHLDVRGRDDRSLGHLDGIVINPAERRVQYLVVDNDRFLRHHRYLLPLDDARVDTERQALQVDLDRRDLNRLDEFDDDAIPAFSDDDLLTALFAHDTRPIRHSA